MKHQTNSKPSVRRREHEAMRIYVSTHLDAPRTVSSQCLLDDGDIAATVKDAIGCITTVPDGTVQVGVKNGWVMLRGNLDSWAEREAVERIALHSVGVRGVVNSITVDEKPVSVL
jgi:osmotically-inducible protein OsmY